jgi:hypothetical protein
MRNALLGSSVFILTIAAAPSAAAPQSSGNHSAPAVGGQAVANGSEAIAPVAGGRAETSADKKICRQLPSSYSRMTQRVCLTAGEWAQVERDSQ